MSITDLLMRQPVKPVVRWEFRFESKIKCRSYLKMIKKIWFFRFYLSMECQLGCLCRREVRNWNSKNYLFLHPNHPNRTHIILIIIFRMIIYKNSQFQTFSQLLDPISGLENRKTPRIQKNSSWILTVKVPTSIFFDLMFIKTSSSKKNLVYHNFLL